jgi:starch synthase (maltosyl-transferring)
MLLALDLAFQVSPDHPWVAEHPQWFRRRPDGSIQHAENPPKSYEDIYPIDFDTEDAAALWRALLQVVRHWVDRGVSVFRVDNPHTKPLDFWAWLISTIKAEHPDVLFLSEAFTRPKLMYALARAGFSQSYTYFTWRNTARELREYIEEITAPPVIDFFRPNLWPNTPDILSAYLQQGGPAAFRARVVLAATLSPAYGIYGPPFEVCESTPLREGSEEYLHSEKYEIRSWPRPRDGRMADLLTRLNTVRRENAALQHWKVRFHAVDNEQLLVYSRHAPGGEAVLVVVNLDPRWRQSGWTDLDVTALGVDTGAPFLVEDLLNGGAFAWQGARNYVELDPERSPAHIFRFSISDRPH